LSRVDVTRVDDTVTGFIDRPPELGRAEDQDCVRWAGGDEVSTLISAPFGLNRRSGKGPETEARLDLSAVALAEASGEAHFLPIRR